MLIQSKYIYIISILLFLAAASYLGFYIKDKYLNPRDNENILIQKYLLNESPLYGNNKPKLWIHTKHDVNNNTKEIDQPYINMTIKTIVDQCSQDFNICLIDDSAFSKLLPDWKYKTITDRIRLLGILHLLHIYGGFVVPPSFICLTNLSSFYNSEIEKEPSAFLLNNRHGHPDFFMMGSIKNDSGIKHCIDIIEESVKRSISNFEFPALARLMIETKELHAVDGCFIGVQTEKHEPILIDNLMGEIPIAFSNPLYGIYIPDDELLSRVYYNWFVTMNKDDIKLSNVCIAKYLTHAINNGEYTIKTTTEKKWKAPIATI
jgi:hypothetical protein